MIPRLLYPALLEAARQIAPGFEPEPIIRTTNPLHGDYQWNFAFRIAKSLGKKPRELAERAAPLIEHPGIRHLEVAGPGFINIFLDDPWIAEQVGLLAADEALGVERDGAGKTVIIDFSSPNVAKRMHIGHMRSTHIGHALVRMHRAAGWTVVGDNHIGDWGTPFGKLLVAWRHWRNDEAFTEDPVGELERLYVKFGQETDPKLVPAETALALMESARAETAKLQSGDPENTALWRLFLQVSMAEFDAVYQRMGVTFEETLGESFYKDMTDDVLASLEASGIAEVSDGALVVRFPSDVLVVRKRDGAVTYGATDIACLLYRRDHWNPAKIIYITDMRQQRHFQQLFEVGRRLGIESELIHVWLGMLVLPEGAMSTRKGNVVRLVDLMDEAVLRARAVVDQKSPHLSSEERAAIAEAVGVGAVRYADLVQNPQTNVTFEWDRMLSLDGNTAPYLLYSHARCASLLARAPQPPDLSRLRISEPQERELALALLAFPDAVATALAGSRPSHLAEHLYGLANQFNRFYHDLPVLSGGEALDSRLALVEATRRVLRNGLELLGLVVLDRL